MFKTTENPFKLTRNKIYFLTFFTNTYSIVNKKSKNINTYKCFSMEQFNLKDNFLFYSE